jgi:hypothetical protein
MRMAPRSGQKLRDYSLSPQDKLKKTSIKSGRLLESKLNLMRLTEL